VSAGTHGVRDGATLPDVLAHPKEATGLSCMNVQVKCQDCDILYTVMPTWHTKRGTTMEPKYNDSVRICKGCRSRKLMVSKQHGPPPTRRPA